MNLIFKNALTMTLMLSATIAFPVEGYKVMRMLLLKVVL